MDYEELLKKAKEKLPKVQKSEGRFEIPKVAGHIQGNKTIVSNFTQIAKIFGREQGQLLKYLQRELATPAVIDNQRLILGTKVNSDLINKKIEQYAQDFVLCKTCGKPDTKIIKEDRYLLLKCTACGARHPLRTKI